MKHENLLVTLSDQSDLSDLSDQSKFWLKLTFFVSFVFFVVNNNA